MFRVTQLLRVLTRAMDAHTETPHATLAQHLDDRVHLLDTRVYCQVLAASGGAHSIECGKTNADGWFVRNGYSAFVNATGVYVYRNDGDGGYDLVKRYRNP